jgi:hypothetical protein
MEELLAMATEPCLTERRQWAISNERSIFRLTREEETL